MPNTITEHAIATALMDRSDSRQHLAWDHRRGVECTLGTLSDDGVVLIPASALEHLNPSTEADCAAIAAQWVEDADRIVDLWQLDRDAEDAARARWLDELDYQRAQAD